MCVEEIAGTLTLHHSSVVGRKPEAILCNIDVHLVCEIDGLEELVQGSCRAGNRSEEGRSGSRTLSFHRGEYRGDAGGKSVKPQRDVCLELRKIDLVSKKAMYGTDLARGFGYLRRKLRPHRTCKPRQTCGFCQTRS
jgi:hypothetical protein